MAKRYQLRFNVRGFSKETENQDGSFSGHVTITLAMSDDDDGITFGATTLDDSPMLGQIYKWFGSDEDGIILDESKDLTNGKYKWVTRSVPVTESQFMAIAKRLEGLKNKKYNYFARPGLGEPPQACTTFAKAILRMTGHDIELGDLFSKEDREKVSGIVWHEIPGKARPETEAWKFRPTEPNSGYYPDVENIGINVDDEKHQYGDGVKEAEQGISEFYKSPKVQKLITPLMFPGRMSSADTPGGEPAKPSVRRNPFQEPETVVPRSHMAASGQAEAVPDDEEFDGSTLLTRRRRKKKVARASAQLATSSAPFDARQMFPNSDHS